MKIAIDVAQTCNARAGCACHADALAHAMAQVVTPSSLQLYHQFGAWTNLSTAAGTHIPGIAAPMAGLSRPQAHALWAAIESGETPLPGAPDIVHSNSFMAPATPGAKLVYTVHDLCFWTLPEYGTPLNRIGCQKHFLQALRRADAFHFISETTRDDFESCLPGWLHESRRPAIVARSGLRLRPAAPPQPAARFADPLAPWLFVGTIEPRKNVEALLDAYERYWQRSPRKRPLLLAGQPGWSSAATHQRLETLARRLPIRYLGPIDDPALAAAYHSAFALLAPSHHEGFGLATLEALAFGLPCVASPHAAAAEFRCNAIRFADFSRPDHAADALLLLEADPAAYAILASQATAAAAPYCWTRTAQTLLDFYETLL